MANDNYTPRHGPGSSKKRKKTSKSTVTNNKNKINNKKDTTKKEKPIAKKTPPEPKKRKRYKSFIKQNYCIIRQNKKPTKCWLIYVKVR